MYSANIAGPNGVCTGSFPLALSDPPGEWTLTARDVATGVEDSATFTLTGRER